MRVQKKTSARQCYIVVWWLGYTKQIMKYWGRHNVGRHQLNISQMLAKWLSHGHPYKWEFWKKTCNAECTWELIDIFLMCNLHDWNCWMKLLWTSAFNTLWEVGSQETTSKPSTLVSNCSRQCLLIALLSYAGKHIQCHGCARSV